MVCCRSWAGGDTSNREESHSSIQIRFLDTILPLREYESAGGREKSSQASGSIYYQPGLADRVNLLISVSRQQPGRRVEVACHEGHW